MLYYYFYFDPLFSHLTSRPRAIRYISDRINRGHFCSRFFFSLSWIHTYILNWISKLYLEESSFATRNEDNFALFFFLSLCVQDNSPKWLMKFVKRFSVINHDNVWFRHVFWRTVFFSQGCSRSGSKRSADCEFSSRTDWTANGSVAPSWRRLSKPRGRQPKRYGLSQVLRRGFSGVSSKNAKFSPFFCPTPRKH